ncbi:general transcription factor IIF subunit 2-like [Paramacrobiotus metropolitanus]|uniref:general transcription factor IIF subunit 2-like n=1 Tax=Paramacrobiotus metropolitanus TaxID=2943436 RepID=UPI002445D865|nr:general transcription factor IIF subunit 2-like [Paramacrobiotus metropolitanus]XP_055329510.1 general transcription factor IIF subunit 2-like [Paramacrobiotus metropolitanus]
MAVKATASPKPTAPKTITSIQVLDATNSGRPLWLVKVPKYLSQAWENSTEENVATIFISRDAGKNLNVKMKSKPCATNDKIPSEYEICLRPITDQKMAVMSQSAEASSLAMDGHFNRRADARPAAGGPEYMKLKREQIKVALKPVRVTKMAEHVVNFKPVAQHVHNIEEEQKRRPEAKKLRDEKDVVVEKLLSAFEQHQYYNIKDLATITNQPVGYLKEILREFCVYNTKNPHRNMWELKPEYRHYK